MNFLNKTIFINIGVFINNIQRLENNSRAKFVFSILTQPKSELYLYIQILIIKKILNDNITFTGATSQESYMYQVVQLCILGHYFCTHIYKQKSCRFHDTCSKESEE